MTTGSVEWATARWAAAAPGPNISRYERPCAVRRSRSSVLNMTVGAEDGG
ncbi:hypothetical protein GCM10028772_38320 [Nocardioides ultimimeridianus]